MKEKFIALTYKVPSEPSKHRAYIWRQLKDLGAVYVSHGMVVLPHTEEYLKGFKHLHNKAIGCGGVATLSILDFIYEEDYEYVVELFSSAREEEYHELIRNASRLLRTIDWAMDERLVFSQYEENEEDLYRLQHWLKKIEKRDYFKHEMKKEALELIQKVKDKLSLFHDKVIEIEGEFE